MTSLITTVQYAAVVTSAILVLICVCSAAAIEWERAAAWECGGLRAMWGRLGLTTTRGGHRQRGAAADGLRHEVAHAAECLGR